MPDARTGKQVRTKRADEAAASAAAAAARTDPGPVLVAFDAPERRAAVARRLRRAGFQVSTAETARAGYEAACRVRPGLVVSNTRAPGAAELCRLLRADARLRDTPILLLGDEHPDPQGDETADEAVALRAGADAFLPASADSLRFVAVAARLLERALAGDYYRDLVERARDIIYTLDLEGRLTSVNTAGLLFLERGRHGVIGQRVGELLGLSDGADTVQLALRRLREAGARREEIEVSNGAGTRRWLEIEHSLVCDHAGIPTGVRGVARDATERKRIEAALRHSEERYRELIDNANDVIYTLDLEGRYTSLNRAGERATGYTAEEVRALTWEQVVAPEHRALTHEMLARKLNGQATRTFYEVEIVARDGHRVPLEVSTQLIYEGGRPVGVHGIARDLTERRQAEESLRARFEREADSDKMRSLGQLSAGVAHNFNNALAAILGRTQLLLRAATNERQRHSLQVIETAARDAAEMVRRIQTFARRAPSAAQFEAVTLAHLINDAVQLTRTRWRHDAGAHGLDYDVRFDAGASADEQVAAQSSELREVFVNLIFNALDAMPAGGVIDVRQERAGEQLVVRVSDTGSGVSPELRERIFEPFFSTKGALGTGLGLAVSYGIITRHGGTIEVGANETGAAAGTTFTLRFPCLDAPPTKTTHKE